MKKAVILFSGGIDSTVMLAMALKRGVSCYAISFDYNQKHINELKAATEIAKQYNIDHHILKIDPSAFKHSSLVSQTPVAKQRSLQEIARSGIPSTYVPARNTLFLAYAVGQAEIIGADEIHFGANALDQAPYVDCRPEYVERYQHLINIATKQAVEGSPPQLVTPLIQWTKVDIVRQGLLLKAPLDLTWSCYEPSPAGTPCGECDACVIRHDAFFSIY
jgi:7-cyano-7-deazaguanine synthase